MLSQGSGLFWALVLLLLLVIMVLGIVMQQTIGEWCLAENELCQSEHFADNSVVLVGALWRSCFTVFRCLTGGCTSSFISSVANHTQVR